MTFNEPLNHCNIDTCTLLSTITKWKMYTAFAIQKLESLLMRNILDKGIPVDEINFEVKS